MPRPSVLALFLCLASPAFCDPFDGMSGAWTGSGWARQTPGGPQETVRCRLDNTHDAGRSRLWVAGVCAVPGRRFEIGGAMTVGEGGRVSGSWANPDGPGQTAISGQIQDDAVYFTFRARPPGTSEDVSQIVTWRLAGDGLTLRSLDRASGLEMAQIEFSR